MSLRAFTRRLVHATGKLDVAFPYITLFDDILAAVLPAGSSYAYAGYVNGMWPTFDVLKARFPHARLLDISVWSSADATALDIENGDAAIGDAPAWYERQVARGVYRPVLYIQASSMKALEQEMASVHIARASYRLWSAHYGLRAHLCSPAACGYGLSQADGTQWTQTALGRSLDQSILLPGFFDPRPPPAVPAWQEAMMNVLPTLQQGAADDPGRVKFVHRAQALTALVGTLNGLHAAQALAVDGAYDESTTLAVAAVQKFFGLKEDGVTGPATWKALVTGAP